MTLAVDDVIGAILLRIQDTCAQYRLSKDLGCRCTTATLLFRVVDAPTSRIGQGLKVARQARFLDRSCICMWYVRYRSEGRVYAGSRLCWVMLLGYI